MKLTTLFLILSGMALWSVGQAPALTAVCQVAGNPVYPDCVDGEITFSSTSFSGNVDVLVTNRAGKTIDSGEYTTQNGNTLTFTENMSIADTYTVSINGTPMLTVTTNGYQ